jgi:hypothetical protein
MLHKLLTKLIKTASGRTKFVMAVIGLSIAMTLILAALQVQVNFNQLLHGKTNQDSVANFLVLNKELNNNTIGSTDITQQQLGNLKKQSLITDIGILTPSRFKATLQSSSDRFPFYTDIAFESVPAGFIDVNSKEWAWQQGDDFVPVIAPSMFLDFYNFQFSFSQNMPQLTQDVVKMITFKINLQTAAGVISFNGRIVGFSDRITSLLVPESFMQWANTRFGQSQAGNPSRVVIKTTDPGNPQLVQYLKQQGFFLDADKTRFSKYRGIVNTVVNISWATGAVMMLMAILIFTLFIQLTVASCRREIVLLITLGAAPKQLKSFLMRQFFPANVIITVVVLVLVSVLQYVLHWLLQKQNMQVSPYISVYTVVAAAVILAVLWLVNYRAVQKNLSGQAAR